jgi:hypothetical protein
MLHFQSPFYPAPIIRYKRIPESRHLHRRSIQSSQRVIAKTGCCIARSSSPSLVLLRALAHVIFSGACVLDAPTNAQNKKKTKKREKNKIKGTPPPPQFCDFY